MSPVFHVPCELFAQAVAQSRDGITIADAHDHFSLVYVNHGFEVLTGYSAEEIIRLGYRVLQRDDIQQPELEQLQVAVSKGESCQVTLRNYRKDGSMFWNELSISPVRDAAGALTHYIGIQKDVTARVVLERYLRETNQDLNLINQQLSVGKQLDPLVGLSNSLHFNEVLDTLMSGAMRSHGELAVLMVEINHFAEFNERYGAQAGDECLRLVGHSIAKAYTRHSDCASRYEEEKFVIASMEANLDEVRAHAKKLGDKVRSLGIPHSDSPQGIVTISIGGIVRIPTRGTTREEWLRQAHDVLRLAERQEHEQLRILG